MSKLLQLSLACVTADLHEGRLVSDELIAYGHHKWQVVSHPVLHLVLQILQRMIFAQLVAHLLQNLTEGLDFHLELHCWSNVSLGIDGHFLDLLLEVFVSILKILGFSHLSVLVHMISFLVPSCLLRLLEHGQLLCSVLLLLF